MGNDEKTELKMLQKIDMEVRNQIEKTRSDSLDNLFLSLSSMGSPIFSLILASGAIISASGYEFIPAILLCWAGVYPIKKISSRQRPVDPILRTELTSSFPSAHAAHAFMSATVISNYIPEASFLVFLVAVSVAFSRLYLRAHHFSDVAAGTMVGLTAGEIALMIV